MRHGWSARFRELTGIRVGSPSLGALPKEFLDRPAPSPSEILARLPVAERAANVLRRRVSTNAAEPERWTYGHMVQIAGFGFGTLLDILEAQQRGERPAPDAAPEADLAAIAALLDQLPASEAEVERRLAANGGARLVDLAALERSFRFVDGPAPFAVLRRAGLAVVVRTAQLELAKRVHGLAARALVNWGVAAIPSIAFQARTDDLDFVARVLAAKQGFAWLHARPGWFWFGNLQSSLALQVERALSAVVSADVRDLAQALLRKWPPEMTPPVAVLAELCRQLPGVTVSGTTVWLERPRAPAVELPPEDRQVLALFERNGPRVDGWRIPALSHQLGLSTSDVCQLLRSSPLVVEKQPAVFRLLGEARPAPATRKLRALVVDDVVDMAQTIAHELDDAGFDTEVAASGEAALARFADRPADVVVTDLRMSGVDGLDVLDRVKRMDPTVPVVIMTAFGEIEGAVEAMRRGAFHYVPKPFRMESLRELVERACRDRDRGGHSPPS